MANKNWWRKFKKIESRQIKYPDGSKKPQIEAGQYVRLTENPAKLRKVLRSQWHYHRYEFVYIIETSAFTKGKNFEPYWFSTQFEGY